MTEPTWQKSTYSEEGSACVYLAPTPTGTILLRESDEPETILTTGPRQLHALIAGLRPPPGKTSTEAPPASTPTYASDDPPTAAVVR
ncbi:hypothetical protein SALBM311S_00424 [Streptomyces alboniger]